jgi:hypothetical protein
MAQPAAQAALKHTDEPHTKLARGKLKKKKEKERTVFWHLS